MNEWPRVGLTFLLLFLISWLLNLTCLFCLHPVTTPEKLDFDAREYYDLAGQVVDGSYQFDSRRVPGHFLILAAFRSVTGNNLIALQTLVTTLASLSCPFAYLLARRFVANESLALLAGLATAFWPLFLIYGRTLYSETTALPFFTAFLASFPRGACLGMKDSNPNWRWFASGVLFALCMLVRPMYLIFTPFIPLILWIENGRFLMIIRPLFIFTLGSLLTLAPWSSYASYHVKKPLLLSSNGGETLAGGLNPRILQQGYRTFTTPDGRNSWSGPGKWTIESDTGYLSSEELKLTRSERDKLLLKRTKEWIIKNPCSALYLEFAKLGYMWGFYPFWNGWRQTFFGNIPILFILLLSLLAAINLRKYWRKLAMLYTLPLFVSTVALISWGSWRFREPGDIGLIIVSVFFLYSALAQDKLRFRS